MKKRDKILSIFLVLAMLITFIPMDMAADIFKSGNEIIRMNGNTEQSNNGENKDSQETENQIDQNKDDESTNSQEEDKKRKIINLKKKLIKMNIIINLIGLLNLVG